MVSAFGYQRYAMARGFEQICRVRSCRDQNFVKVLAPNQSSPALNGKVGIGL
jgi:hypothetical protein